MGALVVRFANWREARRLAEEREQWERLDAQILAEAKKASAESKSHKDTITAKESRKKSLFARCIEEKRPPDDDEKYEISCIDQDIKHLQQEVVYAQEKMANVVQFRGHVRKQRTTHNESHSKAMAELTTQLESIRKSKAGVNLPKMREIGVRNMKTMQQLEDQKIAAAVLKEDGVDTSLKLREVLSDEEGLEEEAKEATTMSPDPFASVDADFRAAQMEHATRLLPYPPLGLPGRASLSSSAVLSPEPVKKKKKKQKLGYDEV